MIDKKRPSISDKEAIIFRLLVGNVNGDMYAKDILKKSDSQLKLGTLYTTLDRMEDKGFVESRIDETKYPRRIYKVTGYGVKLFELKELEIKVHDEKDEQIRRVLITLNNKGD